MKPTNFLKTAVLIVCAFLVFPGAKALNEKLTRDGKEAVRVEISNLLKEPVTLTFNFNREELRAMIGRFLNEEYNPVEEWMADPSYLDDPAQSGTPEAWMLDENYFEEVNSPVESWMMDPGYLDDVEGVQGVESWMMNPDYLAKK